MHRLAISIALFRYARESKAEFSLEQDQGATWFAQDRPYQKTIEGVIEDSGSGLRWQHRAPPRQLSWSEAKSYCQSLALGGAKQ